MFPDDTPETKPIIYPGICRNKAIPAEVPHAIRLKTEPCTLSFQDGLQGTISHDFAQQSGDFILKRKDGIIAYQFAVVVDDYLQGINHVMRGCDLLEETPKQIYLQQLLGFPTPAYSHVPVIVDQHGYKLSKQTLATAVDTKAPNLTLFGSLAMLKQKPPDHLLGATVSELLDWAIAHWKPDELSLCSTIKMD
jgi:glutamyl-Q tRNA(Asp) synthetase